MSGTSGRKNSRVAKPRVGSVGQTDNECVKNSMIESSINRYKSLICLLHHVNAGLARNDDKQNFGRKIVENLSTNGYTYLSITDLF